MQGMTRRDLFAVPTNASINHEQPKFYFKK